MALAGFWLVRHGATTAPAGVAIGSSDPPLSAEGEAQARALGQRLARRPITAVYASGSVRAIETASAIAAPHHLRVQVDIRLRELDFGRWEGRKLAELWSEEPAAAVAWEKDLRSTPPSFGESVSQLEERVAAFLMDARVNAQDEIAVVAHRGPLAVLRAILSGASLESTFGAGLAPGSAIWVSEDSGSVESPDGFQDLREVGHGGGGDAHMVREPE